MRSGRHPDVVAGGKEIFPAESGDYRVVTNRRGLGKGEKKWRGERQKDV